MGDTKEQASTGSPATKPDSQRGSAPAKQPSPRQPDTQKPKESEAPKPRRTIIGPGRESDTYEAMKEIVRRKPSVTETPDKSSESAKDDSLA